VGDDSDMTEWAPSDCMTNSVCSLPADWLALSLVERRSALPGDWLALSLVERRSARLVHSE